ncbi:MAG: cobalt ECF transporter T component CbiQ, partial [Deltaproteobacteria bacterium]|nr:cobalt ECF transporter T component CbiQ [Candidatus Tharpella sp.]
MLLVRSSERAKRVHQAMVCRGFCGKFYSLQ